MNRAIGYFFAGKSLLKTVLCAYGLQFWKLQIAFKNTYRFYSDWKSYNRKFVPSEFNKSFKIKLNQLYPCLTDYNETAGSLGNYFFQDLWAARKIFASNPVDHVDIGSRVDGFIAHLLIFRKVRVVDIRPMKSPVEGLDFCQMDATDLKGFADNSLPSISSLHAAEHFGLGRYGDKVDPDACFKFMESLERVLAPGGKLYFSVPIGPERLTFNANRVFAPDTIIRKFKNLKLVSYSAVVNGKALHENVPYGDYLNNGISCGLFEFTK